MKKILSTFIIGFIGFITFCNSAYYVSFPTRGSIDVPAYGAVAFSGGRCFNSGNNPPANFDFYDSNDNLVLSSSNMNSNLRFVCFTQDGIVKNPYSTNSTVYYFTSEDIFFAPISAGNCPECEECQECPTIDSEYCVSNNLCPSSDCPIYTGDGNRSSLFINDIQHQSAGIIDITIPQEISWDYTNENDEFNLDIEGYNVDTEYIDGVIRTQNYHPTTDDLTDIFSNFGYFGGLLVACLFVILVFYMIKKIFS